MPRHWASIVALGLNYTSGAGGQGFWGFGYGIGIMLVGQGDHLGVNFLGD